MGTGGALSPLSPEIVCICERDVRHGVFLWGIVFAILLCKNRFSFDCGGKRICEPDFRPGSFGNPESQVRFFYTNSTGLFAFLEGILYINGTHAPVNSRKIGNRRFWTSVPFGIRRRPTLPGRFQPSTIGAERLNFCVRDGYRWCPLAIVTGNCMYMWAGRSSRSFPLRNRICDSFM